MPANAVAIVSTKWKLGSMLLIGNQRLTNGSIETRCIKLIVLLVALIMHFSMLDAGENDELAIQLQL
uniref:Uncharacterized protein n=1 Tax=Romanomermis culicivorax TaxID=13658 RepID=A0A915HZF3_ROMCU